MTEKELSDLVEGAFRVKFRLGDRHVAVLSDAATTEQVALFFGKKREVAIERAGIYARAVIGDEAALKPDIGTETLTEGPDARVELAAKGEPIAATGNARKVAERYGIEMETAGIKATGLSGRIVANDVRSYAQANNLKLIPSSK